MVSFFSSVTCSSNGKGDENQPEKKVSRSTVKSVNSSLVRNSIQSVTSRQTNQGSHYAEIMTKIRTSCDVIIGNMQTSHSCPEFAIFGFQFGLYHVVVTLSFSFLRSVSPAVIVFIFAFNFG